MYLVSVGIGGNGGVNNTTSPATAGSMTQFGGLLTAGGGAPGIYTGGSSFSSPGAGGGASGTNVIAFPGTQGGCGVLSAYGSTVCLYSLSLTGGTAMGTAGAGAFPGGGGSNGQQILCFNTISTAAGQAGANGEVIVSW
jgi:hypothetical protein